MSSPGSPWLRVQRVVRPLMPATGLWWLAGAALLFVHRPWPPDETRLLAVAWEMWSQHFPLIPVLNGQVDATQMPMLPWLLMLMWKLFGVHAWSLQVLGAIFALGAVAASSRIVTYLWMDQIELPRYVPMTVIGSWFWLFAMGMSPEACALAFLVSLAILGMLRAWRHGTRAGWLIFGIATGAAILTSGPIALVYVLPVGLVAPLWAGREHSLVWRHWYMDLGSGVGVAVGMVVLWGMAIVSEFGQPYAFAYLAAAAPRISTFWPQDWPPYAYLLMFLPMLLPWSAWPLVYQRLWQARGQRPGIGAGFVLWWVVPAVLLLSLFTVPQPQWLLPLLPVGSMLVAYLLLHEDLVDHGEGRFAVSLIPPLVLGGLVLASLAPLASGAWVARIGANHILYAGLAAAAGGLLVTVLPRMGWGLRTLFIVAGVLLAATPIWPDLPGVPSAISGLPWWVGAAVALMALATAWAPHFDFRGRVVKIAVFNTVLAMALFADAERQLFPATVVDGPAALLIAARARGQAIAHVGEYDGRYSFAARLQEPMTELAPEQVSAWAARHPDGLVVADAIPLDPPSAPVLEARSLRTHVRIWQAKALSSLR